MPLTAIDLFSGAGGLSTGLERAGWRTVAAVDSNPDCIATMERNQSSRIPVPGGGGRRYLEATRIIYGGVGDIRASDLRPVGASRRWRPDLLAGGPPCQPFSPAGRMEGLEDPRGQLFLQFVRLASELRPRFILFENVAGLVTAKSPRGVPGGVLRLVHRSFEELGYACRFDLVNAADYGAPQRRVRLLMIASATEALPEFPHPTHHKMGDHERRRWVTLSEFLAVQPRPDPADIVRPSKSRADALALLVPGTGLRATGIVEANRPGGHWGYRQDCFLADPELPARTIRAASTPDWVFDSHGRLRRLTWRECAGLQGFPGEWAFSGTVASKFRQIGNAVQGQMAEAVGRALLHAATERRAARPSSPPWPATFHRRVRYTEMETKVNGAHREAARQARSEFVIEHR